MKWLSPSRGSARSNFQEDCRNIWSNWPWHSRIQPSHTPTPATSSTLPVCMTHTYDFAHTSWQDGCSTSTVPPTTPPPGAGSLSLRLPEAGSLHIDLSLGLQIRNLGYLFDNEPIGSSHGPAAHSIGEDPPPLGRLLGCARLGTLGLDSVLSLLHHGLRSGIWLEPQMQQKPNLQSFLRLVWGVVKCLIGVPYLYTRLGCVGLGWVGLADFTNVSLIKVDCTNWRVYFIELIVQRGLKIRLYC